LQVVTGTSLLTSNLLVATALIQQQIAATHKVGRVLMLVTSQQPTPLLALVRHSAINRQSTRQLATSIVQVYLACLVDCAKSSSISAGGDRDVADNVKSAGGNSLQTTDSGNQQGATSPGGTGKAFSVQCSSASDSSQCELRLSVSKSKAHDVGVLS